MRATPLRTCLGCRQARPKPSLVRLVRSADGVVRADPTGRMGSRGAYVCPDPACLERGLHRGRLAYAFRKPCVVESDLALVVAVGGSAASAGGAMARRR